jgi:hypothetical protein
VPAALFPRGCGPDHGPPDPGDAVEHLEIPITSRCQRPARRRTPAGA